MNANFYLKKDPLKKKNAIRMQCSFDGNVLRYSTGITIEPDKWNKDSKQIKGKDSSSLNIYLMDLKTAALNEYENYKRLNRKPFSPEYLKQYLDNAFKTDKTKPEFIEDFFVEYINDKQKVVSARTLATYKTFYNHLLALQRHYKIKIAYADLNQAFYNKFIDYFVFIEKHVNRTIKDKDLSALNSFLNWSVVKDNIIKNPYSGIKFPYKVSPADTVSLSENELNTLYNLELANGRLDRTRDIFCLECFCGVRYSDMNKVLPKNIKDNHLNIITQKTSEKLHIPLRPEALKLIYKYFDKGEAFPTLSNQKLNDYIKELCKLAGFNELITIMRFSGQSKTAEDYKKFELISTHTARRTFATLSYLDKLDPYLIMKITGHKDLKTFQIYLRTDHAQVSEKFFNTYATIKPAYSNNEIISNLVKSGTDKKIIAEAFGIEIENI